MDLRVLPVAYLVHSALNCCVVSRNRPSCILRFIYTGSMKKQRMEKHSIADFHLQIDPIFDKRQILDSQRTLIKNVQSQY